MKPLGFLIFLIVFTFLLTSCSSDEGDSAMGVRLVKTVAGGCNLKQPDHLKSAPAEERDTVIFSIRSDTLVMFTGINYICCAPFKTETTLRNETLFVTLTDTCDYPGQNCYCKCMCYYTWEFLYTGFQNGKVPKYKVILDDPRQKEPILIMEGTIQLNAYHPGNF